MHYIQFGDWCRPIIAKNQLTNIGSLHGDHAKYWSGWAGRTLEHAGKKIVRRVKSWQAMGFIHFLTVIIPLANLDLKGKKWDGFSSCIGRGDKLLREFLDRVSSNQETMKTLLLDHIPPEYQSQIKPLSQFLSIGNKSSTESVLFSKDSVKEFHCLVIGAFCGFTRAFLRIHDKYSQLVCMDYRALEM